MYQKNSRTLVSLNQKVFSSNTEPQLLLRGQGRLRRLRRRHVGRSHEPGNKIKRV